MVKLLPNNTLPLHTNILKTINPNKTEREREVTAEKREKNKGRKQYFNEKKRCSWNEENWDF